MAAVISAKKQRVRGRPFPKGVSGNSKGRPKGSTEWSGIKKVFREVFFKVGGPKRLEQMCETNSGFREFSKYLIAIMPREVEGSGMGDIHITVVQGELDEMSRKVKEARAAGLMQV